MASYASRKGYDGEVEFAEFLTDIFKPYGYHFTRIGNPEKFKKTLYGDVVSMPVPGKKDFCVLKNYFLEAKKRARVSVFDAVKESDENADTYNKWGGIVYAIQQSKDHKRSNTVIAMSPQVFARLMNEIQGYREQENSNGNS